MQLTPVKYSTSITRDNPAAFIFLIDQSGSMNEYITNSSGNETSKAKAVSNLINEFIDELILTCQRDNQLKDYFEVVVMGYGKQADNANIAWEGTLEGREFVNISELKNNILECQEEIKNEIMPWGANIEVKYSRNIWIKPYAYGLTPMCSAFKSCKTLIDNWIKKYPNSFPPIVFNITDGEASDIKKFSDLTKEAESIKELHTSDGNVLLFNCLLSNTNDHEIILPRIKELSKIQINDYYMTLFDASSTLPKELEPIAESILNRNDLSHFETKCLVLNSSITTLVKLLNIGTRVASYNTH